MDELVCGYSLIGHAGDPCPMCGDGPCSEIAGGPAVETVGQFYERRLREEGRHIVRLKHALERCNEHRNNPHAITGIVDAALADMPPYPEYERPADSALPSPGENHAK